VGTGEPRRPGYQGSQECPRRLKLAHYEWATDGCAPDPYLPASLPSSVFPIQSALLVFIEMRLSSRCAKSAPFSIDIKGANEYEEAVFGLAETCDPLVPMDLPCGGRVIMGNQGRKPR